MTKTLRPAAHQLYAGVLSMFLPTPAENQPGLIADLEGNPSEIKQTEESPQAVPVERPAETASPAEPAHVKRVTEKKAKDKKRWRPGVQALLPGKNDCSNNFRRPKNHYVHQSAQLTMTTRLLLQRKRSRRNERPKLNHN